MEFTVSRITQELPSADALVVAVYKDARDLRGQAKKLDEKSGHAISEYLKCGVFQADTGTAALIPLPSGSPGKWAVIAGLGEIKDSSRCNLAKSAGAAIRECVRAKAVCVAWLADHLIAHSDSDMGHALTLGSMLGAYRFSEFKTENLKRQDVESVKCLVSKGVDTKEFAAGMNRARIVAEAIILTRDLGNMPSNICTPTYVAQIAEDTCKQYGIECEVRGREWIESQGLGLIAAVSRGATEEPKFVRMTYTHPEATKTIALAGKGVTFDSGGYSLKIPSDKMYGMKDDMHGSAAVIAAMRAAAQTKARINIIGLLPLTENMIGPAAVHPGDVFRSFTGKSVEIANTDAEGRLLLADTVAYAESLGVDAIIDLATLTGACVIALGKGMSAVFSTDNKLTDALKAAGDASCDMLWPLPLHEQYMDFIKSDVADIKNTGGHVGGAIVGALFIKSFVKSTPWAHIDLSGATVETDSPICPIGSTGAGAGTLVEYILSYA